MILKYYDEALLQKAESVMDLRERIYPKVLGKILDVIIYAAVCEIFFSMIIITADRLFCALSPLKYNIYNGTKLINKILVVSWLISITLSMLTISHVTRFMVTGIAVVNFVIILKLKSVLCYKLNGILGVIQIAKVVPLSKENINCH